MKIPIVALSALAGSAMLTVVTTSSASVTAFTNFAQWQTETGAFTTITFTEVPSLSFLTTQYSSLGVTFPKGDDYTVFEPAVFPLDGAGLVSSTDGMIELSFSQPMTTIGVHYRGGMQFKLFNQGALIYMSNPFFGFGSLHFAGLISSQPFDSAVLFDPDPFGSMGFIFIDNLYFGPPIPAPGTALLVLVLGLRSPRQRRRA